MTDRAPTPTKTRLFQLLRWLIAAAVFYYMATIISKDWPRIRTAEISFAPLPLLTATFLLCAHFFGSAFIWHLLTRFARMHITVRQALAAWFYSFLGKYVPGKIAIWAGRVSHYSQHGHPVRKTSLLFMLESVLQLFGALIVILITLLHTAASPFAEYKSVLLIVAACTLVALHPKLLQGLLNVGLAMLGKEAVDLMVTSRQIALLLVSCLGNLLVLGGAIFYFINALYPVQTGQFLYLLAAFLFASWIGILSLLTPGGIGVRDGIFFLALQQIMPTSQAALTVLLLRLWTLFCELLSFFAVFLLQKKVGGISSQQTTP